MTMAIEQPDPGLGVEPHMSGTRQASKPKLEKAVIAAISIGFIIWSAVFIYRSSLIGIDGKRYFCLFDDAMVSMRYAWNFSHGLGLVWNPGERVEGYTNFLMTLLMALATLILDKSTAVLFMQLAGVGFMLTIAYLSMRIADHIVREETHHHQGLTRVLAFFCALAYYPLAYWTLMGMETGLLTVLLLSGILAAFKYVKSGQPAQLLALTASLGLAYLTRNDSIVFAVFLWSYVTWEKLRLRADRKALYQILEAVGLFLLFVIGQSAFRYLYYGDLLPNTYTLKLTGMPLGIRIQNGIGFVTPFLNEILVLLLLPCIDLIFGFGKRKFLLLCLALSAIAYQVYVGGDPWDYWRIMSPCMPLLMIPFVSAAIAVADASVSSQTLSTYLLRNPIIPRKYLRRALAAKYASQVLVISATLLGLLLADARFLLQIELRAGPYTADDNRRHVNAAIAIAQVTTSDASVGVVDAGSIPYYTGLKAIDFLGKSDKYIANLPPDLSGRVGWNGMTSVPGHNKYDLRYSIRTLMPTYVEQFSWGGQNLDQWAATRYVTVNYEGVQLSLLRDSPLVLWGRLNVRRP